MYMHTSTMTSLPITLSQGSGVPFYRQIVDQVAALVRSGQLEAGQRLPSYRDLAGDVVVSLITVRRAYSELENAGLVMRKQGRGTFVAENISSPTRAAIRRQAREELQTTLKRVRTLGLDHNELVEIVEKLLADSGEKR